MTVRDPSLLPDPDEITQETYIGRVLKATRTTFEAMDIQDDRLTGEIVHVEIKNLSRQMTFDYSMNLPIRPTMQGQTKYSIVAKAFKNLGVSWRKAEDIQGHVFEFKRHDEYKVGNMTAKNMHIPSRIPTPEEVAALEQKAAASAAPAAAAKQSVARPLATSAPASSNGAASETDDEQLKAYVTIAALGRSTDETVDLMKGEWPDIADVEKRTRSLLMALRINHVLQLKGGKFAEGEAFPQTSKK